MNEKRIPFENDAPKHRKKSKKKGQPRADHKHTYNTVLLHSYLDSPFKTGEKTEYKRPVKVCMICGRIGALDTSMYELVEVSGMPYQTYSKKIKDEETLEKWYVDDYFGKFAYKR